MSHVRNTFNGFIDEPTFFVITLVLFASVAWNVLHLSCRSVRSTKMTRASPLSFAVSVLIAATRGQGTIGEDCFLLSIDRFVGHRRRRRRRRRSRGRLGNEKCRGTPHRKRRWTNIADSNR